MPRSYNVIHIDEVQDMPPDSKILSLASAAYAKGQPIMSDAEFDRAVTELTTVSPSDPFLEQVGSPALLPTVRHMAPMLSLKQARTVEDVRAWYRSVGEVEVVCELKIDGCAVALTYESGEYVQAATRGDGRWGQNITEHMRYAAPPALAVGFSGEIRGEAYIPLPLVPTHAASAQTTVAGALHADDPGQADRMGVKLWCYDIQPHTQDQTVTLEALASWGLPVQPFACADTIDVVLSCCEAGQRAAAKIKHTPIEGIVIKVNDQRIRRKLGATAKYPRWALAWKW